MFTKCPTCKTIYQISITQLREGHGEVLCERCKVLFDAVASLTREPVSGDVARIRPVVPVLGEAETVNTETSPPSASLPSGLSARRPESPDIDDPDDEDEPPSYHSWRWFLACLAMLVIGVAQVYGFHGERMAKDLNYRPLVVALCEHVGCAVPPYRNVKRIRVVDRGLYIAPDNIDGYEFRMVISNEAPIDQAFPRIKLTLTGNNGQAIAERVFESTDYLDAQTTVGLMPVGESVEVQLMLANPGAEVGGFNFELL